jgi:hypothetical protein
MKAVNLLRRALRKPVPVVAFRAAQSLRLQALHLSGRWPRIAERTERTFRDRTLRASMPVLIHQEAPSLTPGQKTALDATADSVRNSDFELLGARVPCLDTCDFSADWRFGKTWPRRYFKLNGFYEAKEIAYDVKFPWELSRFHYLVPLLARQFAGETDTAECRWLLDFLLRWRAENPLAFSVNWYPMEASMRVVSLVMLADFIGLLLAREPRDDTRQVLTRLWRQLLTMVAEHGVFVWENREFTDVRGNHFTANIVALLLAAELLDRQGMPQPGWRDYAAKWIEHEIAVQFCADGVNFEKSCGYHKLVLELFLLAQIACERAGRPLSSASCERLTKAAAFSDALSRPDGTGANFGDTDSATALPFLFERTRSHGQAIELARAILAGDIGHFSFPEEEQLAALFLTGAARPASVMRPDVEVLHFAEGGYVVVRAQGKGYFFMADIGEVGMNGRGGHGHNDLLAFELWLGGRPVVIDPGMPCYTADLAKKADYRRTGVHSTVGLFDEEMARMTGPWTIANDAIPTGVEVMRDGEIVVLRAGHDGYGRLSPGTQVMRTFRAAPLSGELRIQDEIMTATNEAIARWHFPLGPATVSESPEGEIRIEGDSRVRVSADIPLAVMHSPYSDGYGHEATGTALAGSVTLSPGTSAYEFVFSALERQQRT